MTKKNYSVPVLFIIFNRPDTTQQVFEKIRQVRPQQLFVAADGPRENRPDDTINCAQARAIIDRIDWDCQVQTLFSEKNLGCGKAVSNAISWFFNHVEEGVILEDDCVPDVSFFDFCKAMLEQHGNNPHVMMISGTSFLFNKIESQESYFFSKYYSIWGWATWKRAWQHYDFELNDWQHLKHTDWLKNFFKNPAVTNFWAGYFDRIVKRQLDTWDVQWTYACIKQQGLAIVPYNNLISNIGLYGAHANGKKSEFHEMPIKALKAEIVHPANITSNVSLNKKIYLNIHVIQPFKITRAIKNLIRPLIKRSISFSLFKKSSL